MFLSRFQLLIVCRLSGLITVNNNNSSCIKCKWRQGEIPAVIAFIPCKSTLHLQFSSHDYTNIIHLLHS